MLQIPSSFALITCAIGNKLICLIKVSVLSITSGEILDFESNTVTLMKNYTVRLYEFKSVKANDIRKNDNITARDLIRKCCRRLEENDQHSEFLNKYC